MLPTIEFCCDNNALYDFVPREKINVGERWIKHVHCDGARFHVLSYYFVNGFRHPHDGTVKIRCSEPDCIYNKNEKG